METSESRIQGSPCRNCGGTLRYQSNRGCVTCQETRRQARRKADTYPKEKYHGQPCGTCGGTERYPQGNCVPCCKKKALALRTSPSGQEYSRAYMRKRRAENPEWAAAVAHKGKMRKYGITPEDYARMLTEQGGVCDICGGTCGTGTRLAVDHCHTVNKVRGLLCRTCNTAIGLLKEDPELFSRAVAYLNKHK
jgi:hypothetical protein